MKLQLRILLLFMCFFLASAVVLAAQRDFDVSHSQKILTSELNQHKTYFNNVVNLDGQSLNSLAVDYSFWDDFVTFLKTDDVNWAHENLDSGLSTFNADADWVYKSNGQQLYSSTAEQGTSIPPNLSLPSAFFQQLNKSKFIHFYTAYNGNLIEIRGATIVPGDDPEHTTPAQGYWLVGRLINTGYVNNLSQLTQSTVRVGSPTANADDHISSSGISFGEHLQDWNGQLVGTILVSSKVQVISELNNTYDSELRVLAIFSLAIILLIAFASWRFVIRPINLITNSIAIKRPDLLGDLSTSKTEFGSLASTVQAFFQQKSVIAESEIHKQKLESQSKQTSAFLTTTVQELRGPIESIHQSTNLIATKVMQQAPAADIRHLLDNITAQLSRTDVLMHDLQSASEGKAALRFQLQDIDFGAFLDREIERLRPSTVQQIVVTNQTHLLVRGDVDRLGQVLTNLLHTATQRAPEKSTIEVIAQSQDNQVLMTIHDSGPAISADQQQHIFDEPKQTSTNPADTSGDMPMSKRIIDQMGGRIWIMSDPEKGNFIHLAVPGITVNSSPETFTAAVQ